jgi:hypothetical protein
MSLCKGHKNWDQVKKGILWFPIYTHKVYSLWEDLQLEWSGPRKCVCVYLHIFPFFSFLPSKLLNCHILNVYLKARYVIPVTWEDCLPKLAQTKTVRPYLKNNWSKTELVHGSSGRAPTYHLQCHEFKSQYYQKKCVSWNLIVFRNYLVNK